MALTKISNNSLSSISTLPASIPTGSLTLISTQTASSSASIEFTSGIDSTYDSYIFKFIDIHPQTDNVKFTFQCNAVGGSGYNETITSTAFGAYHNEGDTDTGLGYVGSGDQAQGTAFQQLISNSSLGADNDQSFSGYLQIFNPSSTTYVKHFISTTQSISSSDYSINDFHAGYINTTSAIDQFQFKMSSGNIDDGIIKLYGVS